MTEITNSQKIADMRRHARGLSGPERAAFATRLQMSARMLEAQAEMVLREFGAYERRRAAAVLGPEAGEAAFQRVLAGDTVAGARTEAAALRSLADDVARMDYAEGFEAGVQSAAPAADVKRPEPQAQTDTDAAIQAAYTAGWSTGFDVGFRPGAGGK